MHIVAFAATNSKYSINLKLLKWLATYFANDDIEILDLNAFEMPLYSADKEKGNGIPPLAMDFAKALDSADLLLIALAEHNGAYTVAFKNILDWVSRIPNRTVFENKPIFLMATSPGRRGASTVLTIAEQQFPYLGGAVLDTFSLPSFKENFEEGNGITEDFYRYEIEEKIKVIQQQFYRQNLLRGSDFEFGKELPSWELVPIFDEPVPTIEDYRGKPLLILIFSLGCPGCIGRAIPFANRVVYEDRGVNVLGIHTRFEGPAHQAAALKKAKEELYIRFPYYSDKDYAQTFWKYKSAGTPQWVLIDGEGIVHYAIFGSEPNNALLRLDLKIQELRGA